MRRVLLGLALAATAAWGATATETWAVWRAGGPAYTPLDLAEREALLRCEDPGALGLARVVAQDVRVDCPVELRLAWFEAHAADRRVARALASSDSPRGELRRSLVAWLAEDRAPLSTALEHPELRAADRAEVVRWLAGERELPALHPRTREELALQRLDADGWVPEPWVAARALGDGGDSAARAYQLERELNRPVPCSDDCAEVVHALLRSLEPQPPLSAPPPLAALGPRGEDAAERLGEAIAWVVVDPVRLGRLRPRSLLVDGASEPLRAWAVATVAMRAGVPHQWVRGPEGVTLAWEGPAMHFDVCAGTGALVAADLGELALSEPREPVVGEATTAVAGRLLRSLEQRGAGLCLADE